jgi:hypothetical protein
MLNNIYTAILIYNLFSVPFLQAPGRAEKTHGRRARTYESLIFPKDFEDEGRVFCNRINCIPILKLVIRITCK